MFNTTLEPLGRLDTPVNSASYWLHLYQSDDPDDPDGRPDTGPVLVLVDPRLGSPAFGAAHPHGLAL